MTKQSPHKRWKGCCPMCGRYKGHYGDKWSVPYQTMRKLGVSRRYKRSKAYGED